jgi:F0F1-type ATP synthase delta subunit
MQKLYAKAIDELAQTSGANAKKLAAQLSAHLAASGRSKLLPGILRELRILAARRAKLEPALEVASQAEADEALREAKKEGIIATKTRVNHDLIKGWRARSGGTLIDRSAKRSLIDLYRSVTTTT